MSETLARALLTTTPADAVTKLHYGTLDMNLDDAPRPDRWLWIADLLDSPWGLTGRLHAHLGADQRRELIRVATMCRAAVHHNLPGESWHRAYDAIESVESDCHATLLALAAASEIALECIDSADPDFTGAVTLAFESLTVVPNVDVSTVRQWLLQVTTEHAVSTVHSECTGDDALPMSG